MPLACQAAQTPSDPGNFANSALPVRVKRLSNDTMDAAQYQAFEAAGDDVST